jgi:thiamine phosphate synthase YjbQ (UPF0047 family)
LSIDVWYWRLLTIQDAPFIAFCGLLALLVQHRRGLSRGNRGDNADAHLKRIAARSGLRIMGREVVVAVTNGELDFGTWEQILYGEFDDRRQKRVLVKVIGE